MTAIQGLNWLFFLLLPLLTLYSSRNQVKNYDTKIIHYCWLSDDPVPADLQHYMESWKKYLPDYEFIHWSFKNFDKSSSMWVSQAFDSKNMRLLLIT